MGPVQKTSQKPVSDYQSFEKSDTSGFGRGSVHSGNNKSREISCCKMQQKFEWVVQNIRQAKTEEVLGDDNDELHQATDEAISQLEAEDDKELQNLSEQIAQMEKELADKKALNIKLDQIIAEHEKDWNLLEGINFHALDISLDIKRQEDGEFLAGLEAGYEAVDRKVEEIEAMLMQIPFMRDYLMTKRQYEEIMSTLDSLSKEVVTNEQEVEEHSSSWPKRRRLDENVTVTEGGDGSAAESEETADESRATTVATADVISSRGADDNPKDSSPGLSRLPNDSTQMHNPDDVGRQLDDDVGASSVTSLDYQTIGEKELRELNENPDLLSGFERDFDDDGGGDSLSASVSSILIEQRQKYPVTAADNASTKDSGTDATAAKAAADDGGSDSSVFKRPATPLEVSRRPTGGRLRFDQPLSCQSIVSTNEDGGNDQDCDTIALTIPIAKGPPNTSEVSAAAASASQVEAPIHHESAVCNSRPDSEKPQEVSGPKRVTSRTGQVSPSALSSIQTSNAPSANRPSPSSFGRDSTFLSVSRARTLDLSEPVATGSKYRSPSTGGLSSPSANPPRTPDYRKCSAHRSSVNRTPTTPTHQKSTELSFDWKSKLNASPFLKSRDQPKVVEMPQSPMFTTPQRVVTNPETPLSAYLTCDESPLFSSSLSVPPPLSKEAASPVELASETSYGWMQEGAIESGSSYDFVFADREEDDDDAEDDVSAAYFQS